ncbi:glycosyltransferase [Patescibacteria group bacterium]
MKFNLGILLNLGDSFFTYKKSGRDIHWKNNYLVHYPKSFRKPLVFSYKKEKNPFPQLITLYLNKLNLPRFIYTFLLPIFHFQAFKSCQVLRVKQMLGVWPAIIAKILFKTPIVATYGYDYYHFAKKEGLKFSLPFIKLTELVGLKFADKVIVTNQAMHKKVNQIIPLSKLVLLPNGVNTKLFVPKSKPVSTTIKVLTIGRLVYQKNLTSLIKAIAKLDRPVELTIVGQGFLEKQLLKLAKELKVNLKHIRSLPHNQLPKLYQSADIFCLPSHHEGSPKVLLEAMACGLPCVVSDKPFSQFIINHKQNGLLVKNNPLGLYQGIKTVIQNSDLSQKMSLNAHQTILKKFNNKVIINQEIKLLKSIVNE